MSSTERSRIEKAVSFNDIEAEALVNVQGSSVEVLSFKTDDKTYTIDVDLQRNIMLSCTCMDFIINKASLLEYTKRRNEEQVANATSVREEERQEILHNSLQSAGSITSSMSEYAPELTEANYGVAAGPHMSRWAEYLRRIFNEMKSYTV
ncbi:hypothetical protein [Parasitella parasitica]|uniref:Uncharacterized protein n=1 Tax=Parasitella parasitica TaxID=35722 RepID=A0A0B7N5U7_9FUNG|nr:hypothetical protein [Parasitella parasitica]